MISLTVPLFHRSFWLLFAGRLITPLSVYLSLRNVYCIWKLPFMTEIARYRFNKSLNSRIRIQTWPRVCELFQNLTVNIFISSPSGHLVYDNFKCTQMQSAHICMVIFIPRTDTWMNRAVNRMCKRWWYLLVQFKYKGGFTAESRDFSWLIKLCIFNLHAGWHLFLVYVLPRRVTGWKT